MSFFDFFFVPNRISSDKLKSKISQTSELKSTTENVSASTWFISFDGLSNYMHSFRKQLAATFFKSNNCCFLD